MKFADEQLEALKAPLNSNNVKARKQGGRNVSYVEGWHAIAEANRIFGFGAWSRETVEIKCVAEVARKIGDAQAPGHGVSYIAKVRVTVGGEIVREGCGTGHGIDRDLGQAHESALKEAETDAMKRALMTFGNPFGLALYDKMQANVSSDDGSQARFIAATESHIVAEKDQAALRAWWSSDEQKQARRDFDLDSETVERLKQMVMNKLKVAA